MIVAALVKALPPTDRKCVPSGSTSWSCDRVKDAHTLVIRTIATRRKPLIVSLRSSLPIAYLHRVMQPVDHRSSLSFQPAGQGTHPCLPTLVGTQVYADRRSRL